MVPESQERKREEGARGNRAGCIDLIKRKQFCLFTSLDANLATTPKIATEVVKRFEAILPFLEFLNSPLLDRRPADGW